MNRKSSCYQKCLTKNLLIFLIKLLGTKINYIILTLGNMYNRLPLCYSFNCQLLILLPRHASPALPGREHLTPSMVSDKYFL